MNTRIADVLCFAAIAATTLWAAFLYPALPEQMPVHWNMAGEVDGYLAKPFGVIVLPFAALTSWALFKTVPRFLPLERRTDDLQQVINILQAAIVIFLTVVGATVLMAAIGSGDFVASVVPMGIGVLFMVTGTALWKVRKNNIIGIRTPWTLASEEVWRRTNRFAAVEFILGGAFLVAASFFDHKPLVVIGIVAVSFFASVIPVVYSYILYRRVGTDSEPRDPSQPKD